MVTNKTFWWIATLKNLKTDLQTKLALQSQPLVHISAQGLYPLGDVTPTLHLLPLPCHLAPGC